MLVNVKVTGELNGILNNNSRSSEDAKKNFGYLYCSHFCFPWMARA